MTIPELICPKCQNISLFPYVGEEYHKYDYGGVYHFYKDVMIKCHWCEYEQKIITIFTRKKIDW